eukprot:422284-Hanusia_phi.AAC.2
MTPPIVTAPIAPPAAAAMPLAHRQPNGQETERQAGGHELITCCSHHLDASSSLRSLLEVVYLIDCLLDGNLPVHAVP